MEGPVQNDLVQDTAIAVNDSDNGCSYSGKKELKGLAIVDAALESIDLLYDSFRKRIVNF